MSPSDWHIKDNGSMEYKGKKSFKFTQEDYDIIRSLQGSLSVRQASAWWHQNYPDRPPISVGMIHYIWKGKYGKVKVCDICGGMEKWGQTFDLTAPKQAGGGSVGMVCDSCIETKIRTEENKKRRVFEESQAAKQLEWLKEEEPDMIFTDLPSEFRLQVYKGANPEEYTFSDLFPDSWNGSCITFDVDITKSDEIFGAIYAITFPQSDKVYVGLTTKSVTERYRGHFATTSTCGIQEYRDIIQELTANPSKKAEAVIYLLDTVSQKVAEEIGTDGALKMLHEKEKAWMFKVLCNGHELFNTRVSLKPEYYADAIEYMRGSEMASMEDLAMGVYFSEGGDRMIFKALTRPTPSTLSRTRLSPPLLRAISNMGYEVRESGTKQKF